MQKKFKNPYDFSARTRKAMIETILKTGAYPKRYYSQLCWDVKVWGADFSMEHLIQIAKADGYLDEDFVPNPLQIAEYEERIENGNLVNWAIEDAQRDVLDSDCYRTIWDEEEPYNVEFGFDGRSGGWLCVTKIPGANFHFMDRLDFKEYLDELPFRSNYSFCIWDLYRLCVQWEADFSRENVNANVEYKAAFTLAVNLWGE